MAIFNEAGRGRKHCTACGKFVGVRSRSCDNCGVAFGGPVGRTEAEERAVKKSRATFNPLATAAPATRQPTPRPVVADTDEKETAPIKRQDLSTHSGRVERLRDELIRELKPLSRGYAKAIIDEITNALKNY